MTNSESSVKNAEMVKMLLGDKVVAFKSIFVKLTGSVTSALQLSQLTYWDVRKSSEFFYKTIEETLEETGLTEEQQTQADKKLVSLGLISKKLIGIPAKRHYKVNWEAIISALELVAVKHGNCLPSNTVTVCRQTRQLSTETTTENTTENIATADAAAGKIAPLIEPTERPKEKTSAKKERPPNAPLSVVLHMFTVKGLDSDPKSPAVIEAAKKHLRDASSLIVATGGVEQAKAEVSRYHKFVKDSNGQWSWWLGPVIKSFVPKAAAAVCKVDPATVVEGQPAPADGTCPKGFEVHYGRIWSDYGKAQRYAFKASREVLGNEAMNIPPFRFFGDGFSKI